jgi:hypothetical protein
MQKISNNEHNNIDYHKYNNIDSLYNEKFEKNKKISRDNNTILDKSLNYSNKTKRDKNKIIIDKNNSIIDEISQYEFVNHDGIKIYNNIIKEKKDDMNDLILLYKNLSDKIFTKLIPSTLTAKGNFQNIQFNEEEFIKILRIPSYELNNIIKIGCNFGEIYVYPNPYKQYDIETLINAIDSYYDNKHLLIQCNCTDTLKNIDEIIPCIKLIKKKSNKYLQLCQKIKDKLSSDQNFSKKKITQINKNFIQLQKFKPLSKDEIDDLYNTLEYYVYNKKALNFMTEYLDILIKVISYFIKIEKSCLCLKRYKSENNLQNLDLIINKNIKESNRGRKPKEKKKNKRKIQGTGKYFSSQITFEVFNKNNSKIYKIKIFRNGNFQIPGVKTPDMTDLLEPLTCLKKYFNHIIDEDVNISYILSVMRNYTCRVKNIDLTILLDNLEEVFNLEKNSELDTNYNIYYNLCRKYVNNKFAKNIIYYLDTSSIDTICEINNNCERYPGLLIKFNKPTPNKENKKLTIKILSSGKINFDGGNSELEVIELYYWLQYIFGKYWDDIIFDPEKYYHIDNFESDDSASGYESIYDDEKDKLKELGYM